MFKSYKKHSVSQPYSRRIVLALKEAVRISCDPNVKGYATVEELFKAIEDDEELSDDEGSSMLS